MILDAVSRLIHGERSVAANRHEAAGGGPTAIVGPISNDEGLPSAFLNTQSASSLSHR